MTVHTIVSISQTVCKKFPRLTLAHQDDFLALLEELHKQYGSHFFNEKLTLQNAIRLTALKYIIARNILMDMTGENLHDVFVLHPILEAQEPVFNKIDLLHRIKNSFPDYPVTHLPSWQEKMRVLKVADLNFTNIIQLLFNRSIGEMLIANPRLLYYFMPKGE